MKLSVLIIGAAAMVMAVASCGSTAKTASTTTTDSSTSATSALSALTGALNTTSSTATAAYSNGQTTGTALKNLYTQYKADGNKLSMSNATNLLNIASLASSIGEIKNQTKDSSFYKEFAMGLVLGSNNLVTNSTSDSVISGLSSLANIDLSSITSAVTNSETTSKVNTAVSNATDIANSVTNILQLFK